ncbi:hypothetical protein AOQ84DRAFT_409347, partial [Glonium stellatum]
ILDLALDKLVDELPGATATLLRAQRRRAWVGYGAWFRARFRGLPGTVAGDAFLASGEGEYLWAEELGAMTDRGWRRCEELRDRDWVAEGAWSVDGVPVGVSSAVCCCVECKGGLRWVGAGRGVEDREGEGDGRGGVGGGVPEHLLRLGVERSDFADEKEKRNGVGGSE